MTTRYSAYIITLENDIREDDAVHLIGLLRHLKGVIAVEPVEVNFDQQIAAARIRTQLRQKMINTVIDAFAEGTGPT